MPIDYKRYPANWKSYIVPNVIARAGNRCECCGLANKSIVWAVKFQVKDDDGRYKIKSIWFRDSRDADREACGNKHLVRAVQVVLTIAHLDHDETNESVTLDRLKAMCQICHLRYDAKEKYRRSEAKWVEPTKQ